MILYLNLLPKEEEKNIQYEQLYRSLKKEFFFMLALLLVVSSVTYFVKIELRGKLSEIESVLEENKKQNQPLILEVEEFNQSINQFMTIQEGSFSYGALLNMLDKATSTGITFSSLSYVLQENVLSLEGRYEKRDDLLLLKSKLEEQMLDNIDFPITNLLQDKNGLFVMRGAYRQLTTDH